MFWFFEDHQRVLQEREAIKQLTETVNWLAGACWTLTENALCLEADIQAHGKIYQVKMMYPTIFPNAPPIVSPRNSAERWSSHQYGDSTLCLEWGPDTWHPNVTGAQVLESTYKLLDIENPQGTRPQETAPSRHQLSVGQELRNQPGRFLIEENLINYFKRLPNDASGKFEYGILLQSETYICLVYKFIPSSNTECWESQSIPYVLEKCSNHTLKKMGYFLKTKSNIEDIQRKINAIRKKSLNEEKDIDTVILIDNNNFPQFFLNFSDHEKNIKFAPIYCNTHSTTERIPAKFKGLSKKVAIVGLGSMGSKIALSLGRTGVSHLRLIDHDIILPENFCRHTLDWRHVGEHKVTAISQVLSCITPDVEVQTSKLNLTGQESTSSLNGEIQRLGKYDLIIDATANPNVFNLLAAVAKIHSKPLIWGEVYAGGIGGFIARSRPQKDPDPHDMKNCYHNYVNEQNISPELSTIGTYTAENENGTVIPASDADVSVIADHVTRLALDTLLEQEPSLFPYSMYIIGLAKSWIFEAPFTTIPIDCKAVETEPTKFSPDVITDNIKFLTEVLEKSSNANIAS